MNDYPYVGKKLFNMGEYVILLASCDDEDCWASSIPINSFYKLREDCYINYFMIEKDFRGSIENGWEARDYKGSNKLRLRKASVYEAFEYERNNKPYKLIIKTIKSISSEIYYY